jgi:hypothetical protein
MPRPYPPEFRRRASIQAELLNRQRWDTRAGPANATFEYSTAARFSPLGAPER